jgi:LPXTG-site transpeptidase (sortase) family protein
MKKHFLLIGLIPFFLTGCTNPVRELGSIEIESSIRKPTSTTEFAEEFVEDVKKEDLKKWVRNTEEIKEEIFNPSTIGVNSFKEDVLLQIPNLEIDTNLALICEQENAYDFSALHEGPIWICPDASPYLTDIGGCGASIILGHRQWGPERKVFADLDLMEKDDEVSIKSIGLTIDFQVSDIIEVNPEELWQEIAKYHVIGEKQRKSFLILITCTPYGTDDMRLLVILERSNYE